MFPATVPALQVRERAFRTTLPGCKESVAMMEAELGPLMQMLGYHLTNQNIAN